MSEKFEPNPLTPETPPEKSIQRLAEEIYKKRPKDGPMIIMDVDETKREALLTAVSVLCKTGEVEEPMPPIFFVNDKEDLASLAPKLVDDESTIRQAMEKLQLADFPEPILVDEKPPEPWHPKAKHPPWEKRPKKKGRRK